MLGTGFYGSNDPTNSVRALGGSNQLTYLCKSVRDVSMGPYHC